MPFWRLDASTAACQRLIGDQPRVAPTFSIHGTTTDGNWMVVGSEPPQIFAKFETREEAEALVVALEKLAAALLRQKCDG